jgi:PilZ domain
LNAAVTSSEVALLALSLFAQAFFPAGATPKTANIIMHLPDRLASNSNPPLCPTAPELYGNDFLGLLISMQPEIERVCILAALSTNVANAIADGAANARARALITFFPRETARLLLATSRFQRFYSPCPLCDSIATFYIALASAKRATLEFAARNFGISADNLCEPSEHAEAWRIACSSGLRLISALQQALTNYDISGSAVESAPLLSLLESAIRGEHSLLDSSGEITMPSWAERRKAHRVSVLCSARLVHNGREQHVILRDISTTGLGLDAVHDVTPGDKVAIQIGQSLSTEGTIVWANDHRAGILLRRPIHSNDPRVRFCSSRHMEVE